MKINFKLTGQIELDPDDICKIISESLLKSHNFIVKEIKGSLDNLIAIGEKSIDSVSIKTNTMPAITLKNNSRNKSKVNPKIKDHSKDPFVVKKAKAVKALIKKYGLPKGLK